MALPLIVFDLDGTLVDTAPDLVETLNVIFAREGLKPLPFAAARNLVGGGAKAMIARGIRQKASFFPRLNWSRCLPTSICTIPNMWQTDPGLFLV